MWDWEGDVAVFKLLSNRAEDCSNSRAVLPVWKIHISYCIFKNRNFLVINADTIFNMRCKFIRLWRICGWVSALGFVIFVAYCIVTGRGVKPQELGGIVLWIWSGGIAGLVAYGIMAFLTRGEDVDSQYIKENHPKTWVYVFPKFYINGFTRLAFLYGKYGDEPDVRLDEIRQKGKQELYVLAFPLLLSICIFFSFFLWRVLGVLKVG